MVFTSVKCHRMTQKRKRRVNARHKSKDSDCNRSLRRYRECGSEAIGAGWFSVVLNYSGNSERADEAVNAIKTAAGQAISIKADLTKADEVASLFERSLSKFGHVDVVVHSAGIMPLSPIIKNDVKLFDEVIATNLRSTFLVLAQAAQHVADNG